MAKVLSFPPHLLSCSLRDRQKIVGGHMTVRDVLNLRGKRPLRRGLVASEPVNGAPIDIKKGGNVVVGQVAPAHPLGQLHGPNVHQVHSASQAPSAPCALDVDKARAHDAQMAKGKAKPKAKAKEGPLWTSHAMFRAWRKAAGLTQEEAAAQIGTDRTQLLKIEKGRVRYTPEFLENAARAYHCRPGDLITHDPDSEYWRVINAWRRLSPENQVKAIDRLRGFIEGLEAAAEAAE